MPPVPPRLAVVLSHPVQYYAPWFRLLAGNPGLVLRVFYLSDFGVSAHRDHGFGREVTWDVDLLTGYDHEFIPNLAKHPSTNRFAGLHNPGLTARLSAFAPDAVLLFGYAYRTHLSLIARRAFGGWPTPLIFRGDSHLLGVASVGRLKRVLLKLIYRPFSAFLPVGSANHDYFRRFGVPGDKLFFAPHAVNGEHFTPAPAHAERAAAERARLDIPPSARVLLFAGKFSPQKRPDLLLAAFREAAVPGAHLIISGDGVLRPELEAAAGGDPSIHLLPFANQSTMPARYLLGDVFVLPSQGHYETWGLAVNEAMHMGRPVIVSDVVGCHRDLVLAGKTGWVFPVDDRAALVEVIRAALTLPTEDLARMGTAAQQHVATYSYERATAGLLTALHHVVPQ